MPCGMKLRSDKNATLDLTLTQDNLPVDYFIIYIFFLFLWNTIYVNGAAK